MNKEFYDFMCETISNLTDTRCSYDIHDDLTTYEVNSLLFIKIIVAIEDKYGFEFDDEYLTLERMNTIDLIYSVTQQYVKDLA